VPDSREHLSALQVLRQQLADFTKLARTAKRAGDVANFKIWSALAAQVARDVAPYESPKLSATIQAVPPSEKLDFYLRIFERERTPQPPAIEARPVAENTTAPAAETVEAAAEPAKPAEQPNADESQAQASPSASLDPRKAPTWAEPKSLWMHPSMMAGQRWPWH
jgi:hypothetical protein